MNYVRLQNGVKMPQEGFGVFQIADAEQCEKVVMEALSAGYRLIDTAAAYMNEEAVGRAIKKAVFLVKKYLLRQNCGFRMQDTRMQKKHFKILLII